MDQLCSTLQEISATYFYQDTKVNVFLFQIVLFINRQTITGATGERGAHGEDKKEKQNVEREREKGETKRKYLEGWRLEDEDWKGTQTIC